MWLRIKAIMNKDIIKFPIIYFIIYSVVLAVYGVLQFLVFCYGESGECTFSEDKIINLLTLTSYVLTPLIATIGFILWKEQHNKQIISKISLDVWKDLDRVKSTIAYIKLEYENLDKLSEQEHLYIHNKFNSRLQRVNDNMLNIYLNLRLLEEALLYKNLSDLFSEHFFIEVFFNKENVSEKYEELLKLYKRFQEKEKNVKDEIKALIKA